jgi:uroporphyrinogen decarboxylase
MFTLTSKERVARAINSKSIDRLPMWYGAEPGLTEKMKKILKTDTDEKLMQSLQVDFRTVRPKYIGPHLNRYSDGTFDTMWGIRRGGGFWGTALNAPLEKVESVDEIKDYQFPKAEWFDVSFTEEEVKLSEEYSIIGGEWAPFWHEALELVTMEKFLMDFYLNPKLTSYLLERCLDFHLEINERAFKENAKYMDVYWFANDFGTSNRLIIDPSIWRKFVKPLQAKLATQGHKYGLKIAMHSCGDITEIIPDLIDIGIEILNPIQVSCSAMDPVFLKKEYGMDLVFFGAIDYNELLTNGTTEQVRDGVRHMIDILGYDGRYIVAPSHDLLMPEVPAENMFALYDEAEKYSSKVFKIM